jgi:hypothetical protein
MKGQSNYSFGVFAETGVNIYKNALPTNSEHFKFKNSISTNVGVKILKELDERNLFFTDIIYSKRKITLSYQFNEPEVPYMHSEVVGQKYESLSIFVGYRKLFIFPTTTYYAEVSIGADYNNNTSVFNSGNGESNSDFEGTLVFENKANTNLGEKSYTLSSNLGFGIILGKNSNYDVGILVNIPFQSLQNQPSSFDYTWKYNNKNYTHNILYKGSLYYPSLRFTYYFL